MIAILSRGVTFSRRFVSQAQGHRQPPAITMRQKTMRPGESIMSLPKTPVQPARRMEM